MTELFPVRVGNQFGFMDRKGKLAIAPQYSQASCFTDGLALTGTTGEKIKWGYIDKTGKYLIYPAYTDATVFSEGIAFVVSENGEPVAIDKNGTAKFTVKDAEQVENFRDGLAAYSILSENGERWGFLDKEGKTVIPPKFASIGFFSGSLCPVMNDNGKWGFINKEGAQVVDYKFDNVSPFNGKAARVYMDGKWGVIDNTGKYIVTPQYSNIDIDKDLFLIAQGEKFGWVDKKGKTVIEAKFDDAFPFDGNKYAAVRMGSKWGFIDNKGAFIVDPRFDFAFGFDGDLAPVGMNNKVGFADKTGKMAIPPLVDDIAMDYYLKFFSNTSAFSRVATNNNTPKFAGYKWLIKFYHLQFDEAKMISTDDTKVLLAQFASMVNMMPDSSKQEMMKIRIGIKDCIDSGGTAALTYITTDNPAKLQTLYLVNKEGKWLVQFSKNDAVSGSADGDGNDANNRSREEIE